MRAHIFTAYRDEDAKGHGVGKRFIARIEFDVDATTDSSALAKIGKEINQGDGKVGTLYRDHRFPPLGVGDLIVLDRQRWWICEATGWERTEKPDELPSEEKIDSESKVRRG